MVKKVFYEKVGRRYVPVSEYDSDLIDALPKGTHLIMSYPGGSSRRYKIDPNYAAMIAAGRVAEEAISRAIHKASELRPERTPLTKSQQAAWQNLAKEFGQDLCTLQGASTRDIAEAGVNAMMDEASRLMQNESVRLAFEQFELLCRLTKSTQEQE